METSVTMYPKEIAEAVAQVMGSDLYVQKRGKNTFHGYKYATVGDLLDKLQPLMAEAGLVIFQHEVSTDLLDGGNVMITRYEFTLAHTSGAVWPEKPVHTGMSVCRNSKGGFDDKAANKCHTAARKYFLLGLFQVPTGEDYREPAHDAEADGEASAGRPEPRQPQARADEPGPASRSDHPRKAEAEDAYKRIRTAMQHAATPNMIDELIKANSDSFLPLIKEVSEAHYDRLMTLANGRKQEMYSAA